VQNPNSSVANSAQNAVKRVAQNAGLSVPDSLGQVRSYGDAADAIQDQSKGLYQTIDEQSGNKYSAIRNQLEDANRAIRNASDVTDAANARQAAQDAERELDKLPVDKGLIDQAKTTWKASRILNDIHGGLDRMYEQGQGGRRFLQEAQGATPRDR
jgi:ribosomal protein S20